MKRTKRFATLLLALVMIMCLSVTAFADGTTAATGSITINNAQANAIYKIYKMLDLSVNADETAFTYTVNENWDKFFTDGGAGAAYVDINNGYVTWKGGKDDAANMEAFAKAAAKYAADNSIPTAKGNITPAEDGTIKFDNLAAGYYLITSTSGTRAMVDTTPTNPDATINEKNDKPTNEKTVEEDSTGNYGKTNDADIGQTVNFKSTITAQAGAENYVFHDTMSAGLTFGDVTRITLSSAGSNTETEVDTKYYKIIRDGNTKDGCTFEVEFTQDFCDSLKANDKIVISYTATLNENAAIGGEVGNPNTSKISYGDSSNITTTPGSTTTTYTWSFGVFKYTVSNNTKKPLAGAKFTLSNSNDGNPINLISKGNNVYRVAKAGEENTITEITTDATGKFTIEGLDSDTYYLTETEAPAGYNKLAAPIEVVVVNDGTVKVGDQTAADNTVNVENKTGTELPSTGGIGTTIFYVLGGVLVVGAAVLLATKKRMDKSEG